MVAPIKAKERDSKREAEKEELRKRVEKISKAVSKTLRRASALNLHWQNRVLLRRVAAEAKKNWQELESLSDALDADKDSATK